MIRGGYSKIRGLLLWTAVVVFFGMGIPSLTWAQDLTTAIQDVAKKAIPSVVHVEVTEKQSVTNPLLPFQDDPFFKYFFGNPKMPKNFEKEVTGLGSGILMDAEGHIVTNSHVVNGATKTTVVLSDGRRYTEKSIKVIGVDTKTDLAVIQIMSKESFPFISFGDSDRVDVGQWVVAIGHPQGLDQTVTQGIISAKHRRGISDPSSYQDFLQTDAAINPGNSGGPLLNLQGEVIGVNAAIMSGSGGFEGIGFAIPSNMAVRVAKQLISTGKVERGWVGLTIQNLTPDLAHSFGLSSTKGVLVASVLKDGPAEKAGIKQGDVIVSYQGKPIDNPDSFRNEIAVAPIGQPVTLSVIRDGKPMEFNIKVSSDKEHGKALLSSVSDRFGIEVRPVGKKELKNFGLGKAKGVVVTRVTATGPFGKAGIEVGDAIIQVDQNDIDGPDEFGEILSTTPPKQKAILTVVDHRTRKTTMVQITAP